MKILQIILFLFISFALIQQSSAITPQLPVSVTVTPERPEPGDKITVTAEIKGNISEVIIQVCYGDVCLLPTLMEKEGGKYKNSFYINETTEVELHFKIVENGDITWHNSTSFKVEKKGNGISGFMTVATVGAIAIFFLKRRLNPV